jgi:predicted transcriptional regulator
MSIALSFRTEEITREQLDQVAEALQRNRNWVINAAIEHYLEMHQWQLEQIGQGVKDSDEGRSYSTAEVRARLAKRHTQKKKGKR